MDSLGRSRERRQRFTHPLPKKRQRRGSYAKDSISHDPGFGIMGAYGILREAVLGDSLQYYFEEAQRELRSIQVDSETSAWDVLVSYIEEFRAKEVGNRTTLKKRHSDTEAWGHIEDRLDRVDVDTTAVLRSVIRLYTTDHVYSHLNECYRLGHSAKCRGYAALLRKSFQVAPVFTGTQVFRGTTIQDTADYEEGLVYEWPAFVSASANENQARDFGPVLFVIGTPQEFWVADISQYSVYPCEEEVLFHEYTRFRVVTRTRDRIVVTVH